MEPPEFIKWLDGLFGVSSFGLLWLSLLAIWGGTANYLARIKSSSVPFSALELVGEWTISAFAGVITAYVCYELGFCVFIPAAMSGIAGHMGGRGIALMEGWIAALVKRGVGK